MMKTGINILLGLLLFFCSIIASSPVPAAEKELKNVLILHSYNQGYRWTDDETEGISSVLRHDGKDIELHITYMDAKRLRNPELDTLLHRKLAAKIAKIHFDGAILCDNDALEFASTHRNDLFKGIPVVFCGINDYTPEIISGWQNCTGVVENQDYKGACEIGLRLFPAAKKVFVISDDTTTGRAHFEGVRKIAPQLPGISFTCWNFSAHTMNDTLREVSSLGPDSIVLLLSFFRDSRGEVYSMDNAIKRIMGVTRAPVFTGNSSRIMFGVVGGKVVDGKDQGELAANMMRRILDGTPASSIPVETDAPTVYSFDQQALTRHGIPLSSLPRTSRIINAPPPFYSVDKPFFYAILTSFALLALLVVVLTVAIMQRKRGETELRASEERFRTLFEQAAVGVVQADSSGKFLRVNRRFAEMLGYSTKELEGMGFQSVTFPEDLAESVEQMGKLVKGEIRDFTLEKKYVRKDGGTVWALVNVSLFQTAYGEEAGLIAVAQDISERKRLEEHLMRSEKLSAVGQLASGIAHEFNNILMVIKANLQLASVDGGMSGKDLADVLTLLDKQVERGRDVVTKIISFAKTKPLNAAKFKVKDMAYEVISTQLEQMRLENISPVMEIPDDLEIIADREQLQLVLSNIILNARHAIYPKGAGKIKVSAERNVNRVSIRINDNGIGMNEQTKRKIFLPFFTTKGAFSANALNIKGAGLGLPVCSNIVEMHGGQISVESKEGEWTTFTIDIPDKIGKQPPKTPSSGIHHKNDFSGLKILVVDDEPDICLPLSKTLNFLGCKYSRATVSPFEALNLIQADQPDIVFLDVLMSGMSGMQVLEHIREEKRNICVIMMSGKLDIDIGDYKKAGASGFLQKPFSMDEVVRVLEQVRIEKENRKAQEV